MMIIYILINIENERAEFPAGLCSQAAADGIRAGRGPGAWRPMCSHGTSLFLLQGKKRGWDSSSGGGAQGPESSCSEGERWHGLAAKHVLRSMQGSIRGTWVVSILIIDVYTQK